MLRCGRQGVTVGTACNCRPLLPHPQSSLSAQLIRSPCRRSCDRACGASRFNSKSIHSDIAAELALASSGMTMPFRCAIFLAYNDCAGLTGFPSVSFPAFLGPCSLRNFRQIDIDVL